MPNSSAKITITLSEQSANIVSQMLSRYMTFAGVVTENSAGMRGGMTGADLLKLRLAVTEYDDALVTAYAYKNSFTE